VSDFLDITTRTVAWLKNTLDAGQLTIKPPYQRNPVWVTPQKAALIDTILRGYPIPEIYLQEIVDSNGKEHHYVVDGQQRIRGASSSWRAISRSIPISHLSTAKSSSMTFPRLFVSKSTRTSSSSG
jgi:Protein of unknown function DUF262